MAKWYGTGRYISLTPDLLSLPCVASPVDESEKRKFYALLHRPPAISSIEAVRASIVSD